MKLPTTSPTALPSTFGLAPTTKPLKLTNQRKVRLMKTKRATNQMKIPKRDN